MANKPPAYQHYCADFEMDTAAWTNEEVGAYQRLLNHAWINRGIPSDIARIARIARESKEYFEQKLWPTISEKFEKGMNGKLTNPRQEIERQKQKEYREAQSEAGKLGVKAKKEKGIYPFNQQEEIKQPLNQKLSNPSEDNQGSLDEKSSSSSSSSSLSSTSTTSLEKKELSLKSDPLRKLLDSDQEFKEAFDEARKYFPDIGAWFGKSFKEYGEIAIEQNRDELLATMKAIAKKKRFNGDPWGYAIKTFFAKVRDKDISEQGKEKARRSIHIKDLYQDFQSGKRDVGSTPHRDSS
ncbi:MAG: DUF1376 domain-containing protein [Deltaproteobacteria bacterium]|nr:DUF1376 domain-containing protein [Deltaproteobacteria bacterium]